MRQFVKKEGGAPNTPPPHPNFFGKNKLTVWKILDIFVFPSPSCSGVKLGGGGRPVQK